MTYKINDNSQTGIKYFLTIPKVIDDTSIPSFAWGKGYYRIELVSEEETHG